MGHPVCDLTEQKRPLGILELVWKYAICTINAQWKLYTFTLNQLHPIWHFCSVAPHMIYRVCLINDPFSTSSQWRIFFNIDMRFVANCRYRKRIFFHIGYMKKCGNASDLKKSSENWKHLVLWKSYTYLQLWFFKLLVIDCHKKMW